MAGHVSSEDDGRTEPRLVVVDMQRAFREAGPWQVARFDEVVPVVERLRAGLTEPPVYTRFVREETDPGAWRTYYEHWSQMRLPADDPVWDLAVPTAPGSPIISRPTFSKWGPQLAELVPPGGELLLAGVATDCCVLGTALGAVDAGRFVTVVADACAGADDDAHRRTLQVLELLAPVCRVVTSTDLGLPTGSAATSDQPAGPRTRGRSLGT